MKRFSSLLFFVSLLFAGSVQAQKYVGGDISLLPSYEANGSKYRTTTGAAITDVITFSRDNGLNAMRVRLFVDPTKAPDAEKKEGVRQDLAYVTALGKRIKDAGLKFLLDFHYSDSWADPVKQYTPDAWVSLTDLQLYDKIYNYTKECLQTLKAAGADPDFIQTGNEISYGMCWGKRGSSSLKKCYTNNDANWLRFTTLLKNAIKACREECPQAKIIIHTERVANVTMQKAFYERMQKAELDYDIIGTSFYSYYHGSLQTLETSLNMLASNFPTKDIWLVEVGYFYNWQPTIKSPGVDLSKQYPIDEAGQAAYTEALINVLNKHEKVKGLFWWMMEANEYGRTGSSQVTKDWYNAALWDDDDGKVNPAFFKLQNFLPATGIEQLRANDGSEASKAVYDLQGRKVADGNAPLKKGIYIRGGKKMILGE
ncbi:MAG: glycosyl hydrolase 53 family protein [Prevotella sp.]|nr:glycosyl hydrolase 53 family protein [Prevotella sp.]